MCALVSPLSVLFPVVVPRLQIQQYDKSGRYQMKAAIAAASRRAHMICVCIAHGHKGACSYVMSEQGGGGSYLKLRSIIPLFDCE